jgi:hypothetical protein
VLVVVVAEIVVVVATTSVICGDVIFSVVSWITVGGGSTWLTGCAVVDGLEGVVVLEEEVVVVAY